MYTILIVDDEVPLAEKLVRLFRQSGWNAQCVHSGEDAILRTKDQCFDVILLDIRMPPGIDGFETLEQLFAHNREQCIVFLTGYGDVPSAVQALQLGAWTMVEKGPPFAELFLKVENARKQCAERRVLLQKNALHQEEKLRREVGKTLEQAATHQQKNRLAACGLSLLEIEEVTCDPKVLRVAAILREDLELAELSLKKLFELCRQDADGPLPLSSQLLRRSVDEAFHIAKRLAGRKTQVVLLSNCVGAELKVHFAVDRLADIFEECFVNAIQAAFNRNLTITVIAERGNDSIRIQIVDDGPGFNVDVLSKAHLPYVTTKRGKGGNTPAQNFGLGLHLVKSMVEQSGGSMNYRNLSSGGACIEITLPSG